MHSTLRLTLLSVALSASVAQAQTHRPDFAQAQSRAEGHVRQFPGLSMHGGDHRYQVRDIVVDDDGGQHVRLDRSIGGLRVIGGDLVVQTDRQGNLRAMHHNMRWQAGAGGRPALNAQRAAMVVTRTEAGDVGKPELVLYARDQVPALAWDVPVSGENADGTPFEKHVIVDAATGRQLDLWDDVHTAAAAGTGRTLYSGNVALTTNSISGGYELRDPSRGNTYTINMGGRKNGGSILTDADNSWGNNATSDAASAATDAQYGTAVTWDYYKNVHGRTGIANDGKGAYNRVHYSRNYANAYWSDSCFCMTYGDGNGTSVKPLVSLDVAGHEMSHGVTSRTANLTYSGESGGLNEATSDIFGTMVEFYANNANDAGDYLIGEKIMVGGGSLRSMVKPSSDGGSADCWYSGVGSIDVHYSSGVANHFFFLLAEGTNSAYGKSPTCVAGNTRVATGTGTLTGIGRNAAAKIWYRALTTKMTSSTNYAGARTATIAAAQELTATLGADYSAQVAAAWSAVGRN